MKLNHLNMDDLFTFHTIANIGSITDAADKLGVTYPTVRSVINKLEEQLHTPLLQRIDKRLHLTPTGQILYNITKSDITKLHLASIAFLDELNGMNGRLQVHTTNIFGAFWLPKHLREFYKLYSFPVDIIPSDEKVDLLKVPHAAIGFEKHIHPDIINREVLNYKLKIYGTESYFKNYGVPKSLADLKDHKVVVYGENLRAPAPEVNWIVKDADGNYLYDPFLTISSGHGIIEVVKQGLAIATLAEYIAKTEPDLIPLHIAADYPSVTIYFSYHKLLENSVKIKAFFDFVCKELNR